MQIEIVLPNLHVGQKHILSNAKRFNVVCCGRRFGKSILAEDILINAALDGKRVAYFAPTYKMLAEVWRDVYYIVTPIAKKINVQEKRIELITKGIIDFWSLDTPDVARGRKYHEVVVDEAAMIVRLEEAWQQVIRPTLTDFQGSAWFFSTPKGTTYFKTLYEKSIHGEDNWQSFKMPTSTNPHIDKQELEAAKRELPDAIYLQEYEADFVASEDSFINPEWWDVLARGIDVIEKDAPMVIGLDAATTNDCFAMVGVSKKDTEIYVRYVQVWYPPHGGKIDFSHPEREIRRLADQFYVVGFYYDPYQLHDMATRLRNEGIGHFKEFQQGVDRLMADKQLWDLISQRRIFHSGEQVLSEHVKNANVKYEGTKMRIIKRADHLKIDAAVGLSMACYKALSLNI